LTSTFFQTQQRTIFRKQYSNQLQ